MARERIVQGEQPEEQRQRDAALRPRWLREVIGQKAVVRRLGIVLNACRKLKEALPHILADEGGTPAPLGLGRHVSVEPSRADAHRRHVEQLIADVDLSDPAAHDDASLRRVLETLEREGWHVPTAATRLGIPRSSLYKKLRKYAGARSTQRPSNPDLGPN